MNIQMPPGEVAGAVTSGTVISDGTLWQRLHRRVIWVDAVQSLLSLVPMAVAVWVVGVDLGSGALWPVIGIAAVGVVGAISDAWRWVFTRYRVTDTHVERRTGVVVRSYRSVQRDRIRSVEIEAKLRHRLAGLRVVTIGAGQQSSTGESALALDAVSTTDAERLRHLLQQGAPTRPTTAGREATTDHATVRHGDDDLPDAQVLARFRSRWVVYNVFNIWAYVMAAGLLWGGYWFATMFGLDVAALAERTVDWDALGWGWTIAIGVLAVGAVGAVGLAVNFFTEHWNFELARVAGENGTLLRTRQGLFRTREINRDDNRMRGVQLAEPVLWRWMGMADTTVITTGLSMWSMSQPTAILPRGPIEVARPVAAAVLRADPNPLQASLNRHPRPALRRRLWWATAFTVVVVGLLGWLAVTDVVPVAAMWAGAGLGPLALGSAMVAYQALGHAISGEHLVVRSGLVTRTTAALRRSAVSTICIRQSLLQRRLGLKTVSAMTAAGYGSYDAPDLDADEAITFATRAAPGLLEPFLATGTDRHEGIGDPRPAPG